MRTILLTTSCKVNLVLCNPVNSINAPNMERKYVDKKNGSIEFVCDGYPPFARLKHIHMPYLYIRQKKIEQFL